jgi:AcrR family transcriptional regulator
MRPSVEPERRGQLVAAAARVIARSGYDAATVRDVAREAGVSTGVIAYYFEGKDDLFAHVLREASRAFRERLASARDGAGTPRARLLALAEAATPADDDAVRAHALWIDFWARAARDPALADLTVRLYDGWRSEIAAAVREGQHAGAFRRDADPEAFARGYAAAADGLATHVVLHSGVVSPDDMRAACAALVDALAPLGSEAPRRYGSGGSAA